MSFKWTLLFYIEKFIEFSKGNLCILYNLIILNIHLTYLSNYSRFRRDVCFRTEIQIARDRILFTIFECAVYSDFSIFLIFKRIWNHNFLSRIKSLRECARLSVWNTFICNFHLDRTQNTRAYSYCMCEVYSLVNILKRCIYAQSCLGNIVSVISIIIRWEWCVCVRLTQSSQRPLCQICHKVKWQAKRESWMQYVLCV